VTDGILLVDKPRGITSHDAVDAVRRTVGTRKVGHAGTLDPMATGLLVIGVGRATRLLRFLGDLDKEYQGTAMLGVDTDTLDAEGEVVRTAPVTATKGDLRAAMASLVGDIEQRPPAYSAVKVGGRPLHRAARFDLRSFDSPSVDFRVVCSGGTYVRSLVAEVGARLGCGAHLTRLVRTRIGPFRVADARPPQASSDLLPVEVAVAHLPRLELDDQEVAAAVHGRPLGPPGSAGFHAAFGPDGRLVGIYRDCGARACPEVVLPRPA
jgi:tRNA pseudouridine55 synthase